MIVPRLRDGRPLWSASRVTSPPRLKDLCADARHHQALADWRRAALGYVRHHPDRPRRDPGLIIDPAGTGPDIWVNRVPEPRTVKNRVHWDVVGDTAALVAAGATVLRPRDDRIGWDVLADPEGNE